MVPKDNEFRLVAEALRLIHKHLGDIEDSEGRRFDDPSPNWLTARELGKSLEFMERELITLGAVRVKAYAPCGSPEHIGIWRFAFEDGGSDQANFDSKELHYHGTVLETDVHQIACKVESAPAKHCVCALHDSTYVEHMTASHFAWPKDPESLLGDLAGIMLWIPDAIEKAQTRRPRSAIRECLLLAQIELERLLVGGTAEDAIKRRIPEFDTSEFT